VKILVGANAGGGTDVIARMLAEKFAEGLKQPFVVENRPGAGAIIGTTEAAKAEGDGYTLLVNSASHTVLPAMYTNLPYDTARDLAAVIPLGAVPTVLVVSPTKGYKTLADFVMAARDKPGAMNYGSAGVGTANHLLTEFLKNRTGIEMTHIPYKGAAPLKQELMAGRINLGGDQLSSSLADIKAGKLKALATSASRRIAELPDVPTVRELGYAMLEADGWNGFFAPAKTPREVIDRLHKEIAAAMRHPDVAKRMREMAAEPVGSSPAEQDAILKRQMDQFRPIIKEMRIEG
jgi:tripartite-type tricarboxylate transporter receptor subunit TctC